MNTYKIKLFKLNDRFKYLDGGYKFIIDKRTFNIIKTGKYSDCKLYDNSNHLYSTNNKITDIFEYVGDVLVDKNYREILTNIEIKAITSKFKKMKKFNQYQFTINMDNFIGDKYFVFKIKTIKNELATLEEIKKYILSTKQLILERNHKFTYNISKERKKALIKELISNKNVNNT